MNILNVNLLGVWIILALTGCRSTMLKSNGKLYLQRNTITLFWCECFGKALQVSFPDLWLAAARHTSIMAFFQILWACRASRSSLHTELHSAGRKEEEIPMSAGGGNCNTSPPSHADDSHSFACPSTCSTHNCDDAGLLGMESAVVWSWRDEDAVWRLYPSSLSLAAGSSSISPSGSDENSSPPSPSSSSHSSSPVTSLSAFDPETFSPSSAPSPSSTFVS